MPRRANLAVAIQDPLAPQQDTQEENLTSLRTQWRWAAFCQFFFTFFPLFAFNDVSVADIEQDLIGNSRLVLPRIMQKLLFSISYDRKVSVDNWQTALRKQYNRRAPHLNPIGPEPTSTIPLKGDMSQVAEKGTSEQPDDQNDKDQPLNTTETGASIINTLVSLGDVSSAAPTPVNEPDLTRQSSVVEDRRAPSASTDITDGVYPQQESIDWYDLPMLAKLKSMHTVAEWQFQNPTRLRSIMKSDDEFATWRAEPIGYDSKGNAYWLIGADRLWIQRVLPKALKPMSLKRKQPSSEKGFSTQKAKRLRASTAEKSQTTSPSIRQSRAAKDQAKRRLDAQAKELAELNRQSTLGKSVSRRQAPVRSTTIATSLVMGTRSSARLRGTQDDEWQHIPDEWLQEVEQTTTAKKLGVKMGLEADEESVSDLTELSEDDSEPASGCNDKPEEDDEDDRDPTQQETSPKDFVEWETICSTLREWGHIAERFEKATHYSEKALYKTLVNIVPVITQELKEIERKRQTEEAIVHRKRSSRIALRESEKEEARMAAMRKQEAEDKMSRSRRLEARKQREEEERIKREHARELRRNEREAKEATRKAQLEGEETKALGPAAAKKRRSDSPVRDARKTNAQRTSGKGISSGSRTPVGEDWELACEICNRQGINLDDGTPMMSCGICSGWQHIQCHDRADRMAGRPRRNWNSEEFICGRCRATQRVQHLPPSKQVPLQNARHAASFQAYVPSPLNLPSSSSNVYQDHPPYLSGYNNSSILQNHYGRNNGQQYPNAQYPSNLAGHSILSFSHYQPSQHAFLPSAPNKTSHTNVQSLYAQSDSHNAFQPPQPESISSQTSSWNSNMAQPPGTSVHSTGGPVPISAYIPSQTDNHNLQPVHTYSNHEPQTYTRYPGYKQPVPYQTSLRR